MLLERPADGAWNMAVDEALLDGCVAGGKSTLPTLRLYGWRPAALSLGRFQPARGAYDAQFLRAQGIDLVRRPTGGAAVLHENERTYAVIASLRSAPFTGSVAENYARIARALGIALGGLGLVARAAAAGERSAQRRARGTTAACFGSRSAHEIAVDGKKLVGSAQLRRRSAFLQHGSILVRADPSRLAEALGLAELPKGYTDLSRELGSAPDPPEVDRLLIAAFSESFSAELEPGELTPREAQRAAELCERKYRSREWTIEGNAAR